MSEAIIMENEKLKQKLNYLNKKSLMKKMELELELEILSRKRDLLNLLIPKIDMEDISSSLTSYLFRIFPYTRAMIIFRNSENNFLHVTETKGQSFLEHKLVETEDEWRFADCLINKIETERKSIYIDSSNIDEYKECKKYMRGNTSIAVPILFTEKSICLCYLESTKEGCYSEKEVVEAEAIVKTSSFAFLNSSRASKLCDLSFRDSETKLYNQKYLRIIIENQMVVCESSSAPFSIIRLKITGCKSKDKICDDKDKARYFKEIVSTVKRQVRAVDMVFSLGNYKLAFLINNSDSQIAALIKTRLANYINENKIAGLYLENEIDVFAYSPGKLVTVNEVCKKMLDE